jgi:uncharacterized membrane protein YhfC
MIYFVYLLNFLLMIIMPFVLGWWIARTRGASWRLFGIGVVTFVVSQLFHIPFNWLVQQRLQLIPSDTSVLTNLLVLAAFLGLSAGLFEEVSRYLAYRFWARDARTWGRGLMMGAGHGGIEAIILGVLGLVNIVGLYFISQNQLLQDMSPEQAALVDQQIQAVLSAPWHGVLLGALERVFALCFHLSASLLVMQVFVRGRFFWLILAILWHALINFIAVVAVSQWGPYVTEALIGVMALLSLGIIFWLRRPEPAETDASGERPEPVPAPTLDPSLLPPLEETAEMLERSRYS